MNQEIINNFAILSKYWKMKRDGRRQIAYDRAIIAIRRFPDDITDIKQITGKNKLANIGKQTAAKIKLLLQGKPIPGVEKALKEMKAESTRIKSPKETSIDLFMRVWGVGKVAATKFFDKNMRTLDDLGNNEDLLTKNQKIGLKHFEDFEKRIPRKFITIYSLVLHYILSKEFGKDSYTMTIGGSYRRGESNSGDVDCLITSNTFNLQEMVKVLTKYEAITDSLGYKKQKFMGVAHCPNKKQGHYFRLDIEFVTEKEWPFALLYFTGSKGFNVEIRNIAKKDGFKLNEYGLQNLETKKWVKGLHTEKDILDFLGVVWLDPTKR